MQRTFMGSGLVRRENGTYHIEWMFRGQRHCRSTRTKVLKEAKEVFERYRAELFAAKEIGVRTRHTFAEAVEAHLADRSDLRSVEDEASRLAAVTKVYGDFYIDEIFWETLEPFIQAKRELGRKNATLNHYVGAVRRVLESAALRRNDNGTTWLATVPWFPSFDKKKDARVRMPLSMAEQRALFGALPDHLRLMAEFAVNTGCRDRPICRLRWDQEIAVPELGTSVFVIGNKGGGEVVVPLNRTASSVVDACRGVHPEYVFTYRGHPLDRMNSTGWRDARKQSKVNATPHFLRHTFATRLRAAGVSREDRKELMGHANNDVTTEYSMADLARLLEFVRRIDPNERGEVVEPVLFRRSKR